MGPAKRIPWCVAGERPCPPEDCGGVPAYEELPEALRDPAHRKHQTLFAWLGGPFDQEAFDIDEANRTVSCRVRCETRLMS